MTQPSTAERNAERAKSCQRQWQGVEIFNGRPFTLLPTLLHFPSLPKRQCDLHIQRKKSENIIPPLLKKQRAKLSTMTVHFP